jgi:hypothetical protein
MELYTKELLNSKLHRILSELFKTGRLTSKGLKHTYGNKECTQNFGRIA